MDNQGNTLNASTFYSITEDKDGNIWAGTNIGPLVCYNANNIESLRFNRIVLADESDYLLNGVRVNAIAVDGSNQKWIATEGSGVFLVNAEGTEVLENFTTDNSPLPTNTINSIAINPENGKVFFAVDGYGTLSYQGDATEGKDDYSDIEKGRIPRKYRLSNQIRWWSSYLELPECQRKPRSNRHLLGLSSHPGRWGKRSDEDYGNQITRIPWDPRYLIVQ